MTEPKPGDPRWDAALRLHGEGRLREALARYDDILREQPRHAGTLHYSGVVLYQLGDLRGALERIREAVNTDPGVADAWSNLGLVLQAIGHKRAAVEVFERAAQIAPESTEILSNLGAGQFAWGRHAEAEATARRLNALDANNAKGWFILALALQPQGRMLEALDAVTRAAGLAPDQEGYAGLKAQIEIGIGAPEKARRTLDKALARHPMSATLRFELASVLEFKLAELPAAVTAYEQAIGADPDHGPSLSQLSFLKGRLADWRGRDELVARYRAGVEAGLPVLSPFAFLSLSSSRAEQRRCARTWTAPLVDIEATSRRRILSSGRLRIGYLSADFHSHATAYLAAGLFEHHDRQRFQVFAYSTGPDDGSPMRARLVRAFDRFVDVRDRDPRVIAEVIRGDMIDILVDLKGHTQGATPIVLAGRPAPIQVHYLGYPGTLEGGMVDYLIGDPIVTPAEHQADYSETIAMLPDSYQINDRNRPMAPAAPRTELGLPEQGVVFCSFNQTYKINPAVFDAWMAILMAVPNSVLWLLTRTDHDPGIANLQREAQARGVDTSRLVFARHRPNAEYLALYRHADLFLDTWPYNAHTTASDALWAGCPVLTVLGDTFAARVAASLLHAVGLPELVMPTVDQYIARAIALAADRGEIARLKDHLAGAGQASPLFDTARTTRALEAAYLTMAEQHRTGVREAFRVDPRFFTAAPAKD